MKYSTGNDDNISNNSYKQFTVDEALIIIGMGPFQYKILMVTGLLWSADAIEVMILTFLLPILAQEWNLSKTQDASIGSVVFLGMLFGAIFWPSLSDKYGRKHAILFSNIGQVIFGISSAFTWDVYSMMVTRFITGFCLGSTPCCFTLYAEYAPKGDRGKLLILQQSFWAVGALLNTLLAWLVLETLDWRWYLILSSLPLCLILYYTYQLPESAQFLVNVGRGSEAEDILKNAMAMNHSTQTPHTQFPEEFNLIVNSETFNQKRGDWVELFSMEYFEETLKLLCIFATVTFSYYGVSFLSERFFDFIATQSTTAVSNDSDKYWKIAVTTSSEIPGVLVGIWTLDVIGRKTSLIIYFGIVAMCMFAMVSVEVQRIEWLSVALVFMGRGCSSIGFFVLYVYFSEFYPTRIRNTAVGFGSACSRIAGMTTTFVAQTDDMSYSFYLIGLSAAVVFVTSYLLRKDTTGVNMSGHIESKQKQSLKQHVGLTSNHDLK